MLQEVLLSKAAFFEFLYETEKEINEQNNEVIDIGATNPIGKRNATLIWHWILLYLSSFVFYHIICLSLFSLFFQAQNVGYWAAISAREDR